MKPEMDGARVKISGARARNRAVEANMSRCKTRKYSACCVVQTEVDEARSWQGRGEWCRFVYDVSGWS
jgi:hypothetical protein